MVEQQPNLFALTGSGVHLTYSSTSISGKPQLTYQDTGQTRQFTGDEIRRLDDPRPGRAGQRVAGQDGRRRLHLAHRRRAAGRPPRADTPSTCTRSRCAGCTSSPSTPPGWVNSTPTRC